MQTTSISKIWLVVILLALTFSPLGITPVRAATITVRSRFDDGTAVAANCPGLNCRLRDAIAAAQSGDTIDFAGEYIIVLNSRLVIDKSLTITGVGHAVVISGDGKTNIFSIASGNVTLDQLQLVHGYASERGGAIRLESYTTSAVISNCIFAYNFADEGGAIFATHDTVTIKNSTFYENTATWVGGAIDVMYVNLTVHNSTFYDNTGDGFYTYGGAIAINFGTAELRNNTFTGNEAAFGGAVLINQNDFSNVTISNNLFVNSPKGKNCGCNGLYTCSLSGPGNLSTDSSCGAGITKVSSSLVKFGPPTIYSGNTMVLPLLPGNPAIDAGDDASCAALIGGSFDQHGTPRPQGAHCDSGAFESYGFSLTKTNGDNQSAMITTPFAQPLTVTVTANGAFEPVNNGVISFSASASGSGASITNAVFTVPIVNGVVSPTITANGIAGGPYTVTASTLGAVNSVNFSLTNLPDTIPPVVTVPDDITGVEATSASGAVVTFSVSATDQVDGSLTPICSAQSGDTFPLGTTTVTCSATDTAGNTGSDSFDITIVDTTAPTVSMSSSVTDPTNFSPIPVTVTFSESVVDFTADDVICTNGVIEAFTGSGVSYTFTLLPASGGLVTVDIAAGAAQDAAGNPNIAAETFSRFVEIYLWIPILLK